MVASDTRLTAAWMRRAVHVRSELLSFFEDRLHTCRLPRYDSEHSNALLRLCQKRCKTYADDGDLECFVGYLLYVTNRRLLRSDFTSRTYVCDNEVISALVRFNCYHYPHFTKLSVQLVKNWNQALRTMMVEILSCILAGMMIDWSHLQRDEHVIVAKVCNYLLRETVCSCAPSMSFAIDALLQSNIAPVDAGCSSSIAWFWRNTLDALVVKSTRLKKFWVEQLQRHPFLLCITLNVAFKCHLGAGLSIRGLAEESVVHLRSHHLIGEQIINVLSDKSVQHLHVMSPDGSLDAALMNHYENYPDYPTDTFCNLFSAEFIGNLQKMSDSNVGDNSMRSAIRDFLDAISNKEGATLRHTVTVYKTLWRQSMLRISTLQDIMMMHELPICDTLLWTESVAAFRKHFEDKLPSCPISLHPILIPCVRQTPLGRRIYEFDEIMCWVWSHATDPLTREDVRSEDYKICLTQYANRFAECFH